MTTKTFRTVVGIVAVPLMLIVHIGFVVFVAVNAAEQGIICCIGMAVRARIPFSLMSA